VSKLVPVPNDPGPCDSSSLRDRGEGARLCALQLEEGNIPFFAQTPFELPAEDRDFLLRQRQRGGFFHKNIAYRPLQDRLTGFATSNGGSDEAQMRAIMRRYSERATRFLTDLLPQYARSWRLDYASFRSCEEQGRQMRLRARNDLLHIDAFPTRPTHGDRILRFFTNINPARPRVWLTGPTFEVLARQLAVGSGLLPRPVGGPSAPMRLGPLGYLRRALQEAARAVGVPVAMASPYDHFMHRFHNYLKERSDFQHDCAKDRWEFPPGSSWMVFTDAVSHAVLSGQFALEQTYIVPRSVLVLPRKAPAHVLESLCGRTLTNDRRGVTFVPR